MLAPLVPPVAMAQETFYLGEHLDFTGNGCGEAGDLNNITSLMRDALVADGWTGNHFLESSCFARDYVETNLPGLNGLDGSFGDNRLLTVYAGHGWTSGGGLAFGRPESGRCDVNIETEMRLGHQAGDRSAFMMYMTSCTMTQGGPWPSNYDIVAYANEQKQQFGFQNSPIIQSGAGKDVFNCTSTRGNADCWNDVTEHQFEFWFGLNTPIVASFGSTEAGASSNQANCRLRAGTCNSTAAPATWAWHTWVTKNSGVGPCF